MIRRTAAGALYALLIGCALHVGIARADECEGQPDGVPCASDGNPCTADFCVSQQCAHTPMPENSPCNDGTECTLNDRCDSQGNCVGTPAVDGSSCSEDSNVCTADECIGGECVHSRCMVDSVCTDTQGRDGVCMIVGTACVCAPFHACCVPDGSCVDDLPQAECAALGGFPSQTEEICLGDMDGDGLDDACLIDPIPAVPCWPLPWLAGLVVLTTAAVVWRAWAAIAR